MGGHRQRRTQRQGSHECKQYRRPLPNSLFIACEAMVPPFQALRMVLATLNNLGSRPQPRARFAVVVPPQLSHPCSPSWNCVRMLFSLLALQCPGLVRPAAAQSITGTLVGARGSDHQRPCPWRSPHQLVQCSSDGPARPTPHMLDNQAQCSLSCSMGTISSSAPSPPPAQRVGAHLGTNHASVSRSKKAARDMLELMTMCVVDPAAV